jgi:hypothetical protein
MSVHKFESLTGHRNLICPGAVTLSFPYHTMSRALLDCEGLGVYLGSRSLTKLWIDGVEDADVRDKRDVETHALNPALTSARNAQYRTFAR